MSVRDHFIKAASVLCAVLFFVLSPAEATEKNIFTISVPFKVGAEVTVTTPDGKSRSVAEVKALPEKTRWPSYTASAWSTPGTVCASAVNAIHMLVSSEKDQGRTMSIIPQETIAPAAGPGASVVLSSEAGTGLFGAWAPQVGSPVTVKKADGSEAPLSANNLPKEGDTLIITAEEFDDLPYMVEIENRPGGRVIGWKRDGYDLIGRVIRPLGGSGRFEGTVFQRIGAIRANHSGVIDVSTTPRGVTGGFQIIPWDHALRSKEMQHVWNMTQWLVVGPADGKSPMGATPPLFKQGLISGPAQGESLWDVWSTYGRKSLVLARYNHGPWQRLKEAAGRDDNAFKEITDLRIYYPFTEEIQKPNS